ncbi:hypothetical protein [Winogradskyella sp. PC D3.3]
MEHSNDDRIINLIVSLLEFGNYKSINPVDIRPHFEIKNSAELTRIFKIAESENLLERKNRTGLFLTKKGFDIQKSGGWLKHLESLQEDKKKQLKRESKKDEILDLDLTLKRFESKIGKKLIIAGFIITLLSFLITIITIEFWHTDIDKIEQSKKHNKLYFQKKELKK